MKKILFGSIFLLLFSGQINAQLGFIGITDSPCICSPGGSTMAVSQLPGATYYQWETLSCSINNLLFNGSTSPYQSTTHSINVACMMVGQYCVVCVTAHNATDSSNTVCDTIWGFIDTPVFASSNSPIGLPDSSDVYGVAYPTAGCPSNYIWSLTGDVTFNNGSQTTFSIGGNVNINFGPGFTTGVLCVYATTNFGLVTDTVCMTINAPVGISEIHDPSISCYYQSSLNQVTLEFAEAPQSKVSAKIYDITGRLIFVEETISASGMEPIVIGMPELNQGVYFVEVSGSDFKKTFKFAKAD